MQSAPSTPSAPTWVPLGLPNKRFGNDCWSNTLLQVLFNTPSFVQMLLEADVSAAATAASTEPNESTPSATRVSDGDADARAIIREKLLRLQHLFAEAILWMKTESELNTSEDHKIQGTRVVMSPFGRRLRQLVMDSQGDAQEDAPEGLAKLLDVLLECGLNPLLHMRHRSEFCYAVPPTTCPEPYLGIRAGEEFEAPPVPPHTATSSSLPPQSSPPISSPRPLASSPNTIPQALTMLASVSSPSTVNDNSVRRDTLTTSASPGATEKDYQLEDDVDMDVVEPGDVDFLSDAEQEQDTYDAMANMTEDDDQDRTPPASPGPRFRRPTRMFFTWTAEQHLARFLHDVLVRKRIFREDRLLLELRNLLPTELEYLVIGLRARATATVLASLNVTRFNLHFRTTQEQLTRMVLFLVGALGLVVRRVDATGQLCYNTAGWTADRLPRTQLNSSLQYSEDEHLWLLNMRDVHLMAQRVRQDLFTFDDILNLLFVHTTLHDNPRRYRSPANLVQDFQSQWCSSKFTTVPNGFFLQISRFLRNPLTNRLCKVQDPLPVTEIITLRKDLHFTATALSGRGETSVKYRLRSVAVHLGTIDGGHYIALVRYGDTTDDWFICDDSSVRRLQLTGTTSNRDMEDWHKCVSTGYLYYYERADISLSNKDLKSMCSTWMQRQPLTTRVEMKNLRDLIVRNHESLSSSSNTSSSISSSCGKRSNNMDVKQSSDQGTHMVQQAPLLAPLPAPLCEPPACPPAIPPTPDHIRALQCRPVPSLNSPDAHSVMEEPTRSESTRSTSFRISRLAQSLSQHQHHRVQDGHRRVFPSLFSRHPPAPASSTSFSPPTTAAAYPAQNPPK